jgi:hypothetical protein
MSRFSRRTSDRFRAALSERKRRRELTASHVVLRRWPKTIQVLRIAGLCVWSIFIVLLILYHVARPEMSTLYMRLGVIEGRSYWEPNLLEWMFTLLALNLLICIAGVGVNYTMFRKRIDLYNPSLMLMGPVSLFGFIVLWIIT